jgi:Caspase domain/Domain of unknown function (DUF4384)
MPRLNRRHFLQFASSSLATLGLSQIDFWQQADRYGQVLAQGSPRKFALLLGINGYAENGLRGCHTDVELQYELLVHRFGFNPQDILVLADDQLPFINYKPETPTRQHILEAFERHLIKNAKPGDVVVFHYSGHGSLVLDKSPTPWLKDDAGRPINGTIVPLDRRLPNAKPDEVRDIMGHTIFLLMSALKTQNVTVVLDSCHSGGGTRGNLRVRSTPSGRDGGFAEACQEELDYQARWVKNLQQDLQLSPAQWAQLRQQGIAKGIAIGSARYNQLAADQQYSGFDAGAFTYLLTRYLWQRTREEGIGKVFVNLALSTKGIGNNNSDQDPIYEANPATNSEKPFYFLSPTTPAAEAVIRGQTQGLIEFWLGGMSECTIDNTENSFFTILDATGQPIGEIEQTNRAGLVGYGKLRQGKPDAVVPGRLLRERIRIVPADLKLAIALDESLGDQQTTASSALSAIKRVEVVSTSRALQGSYRLGRMTTAIVATQPKEDKHTIGSIGLFTGSQEPITGTFAGADESVSDAVGRLRPRLIALLAGQILKATLPNTSPLKVESAVTPEASQSIAITKGIQQFKSGQAIQVKIRNGEAENLYIAVLVIAGTGKLTVLYPYWDAPEIAAIVAPGQEVLIPRREDPVNFALEGSSGYAEILVLASMKPLRDAVKTLGTIGQARGNVISRSPMTLNESEPFDMIQALVGDIDRNSRASATASVPGRRSIDSTLLSTTSHMIAIVK